MILQKVPVLARRAQLASNWVSQRTCRIRMFAIANVFDVAQGGIGRNIRACSVALHKVTSKRCMEPSRQ